MATPLLLHQLFLEIIPNKKTIIFILRLTKFLVYLWFVFLVYYLLFQKKIK